MQLELWFLSLRKKKVKEQGSTMEEGNTQTMLLTVEQTMKLLQVGRSKFYRLVSQEGLPLVRSGRWVRVNPDALRNWIEQQQRKNA